MLPRTPGEIYGFGTLTPRSRQNRSQASGNPAESFSVPNTSTGTAPQPPDTSSPQPGAQTPQTPTPGGINQTVGAMPAPWPEATRVPENYYTQTYATAPSVNALQLNGQWWNESQPANTLQPLGTVGANGVNSSTAPEILAARQASLAAAPNPNTPPTGAFQMPGSPGHYVTSSGATWSAPGTPNGPGSEGYANRFMQTLRAGGPVVDAYLAYLRQNNLPIPRYQ